MHGVELHAAVRLTVVDEGLSHREASRRFGIGRRTVRKMLSYSAPPGYRRTKSVRRPRLEGFTRIIHPAPSSRGTAPPRRTNRRRSPGGRSTTRSRPDRPKTAPAPRAAPPPPPRKNGRCVIGARPRPATGSAAPPEDQAGVDVVAASHLGHRNARRVSLRNDPALPIPRPETTCPTRHRKASSHSVH